MKVTIRLSTIEDVRNFVEAIRTFDSDIDLISGRYRVDAKSIMGIFSLDLMSPITLETSATNCDTIMDKIKPFVIAE